MRSFAPLVLIALAAPSALAAPVPKALKKKDDADRIVGTWKPNTKSEWFSFDAEGVMKAWSAGNEAHPVLYTYAIDADPDGRPYRMIWTEKGQPQPSFQAVFVVDGDRLYLTYSSVGGRPTPRPDPNTPHNFTRHSTDK